MKSRTRFVSVFAVIAAATVPTVCLAHGPNIQLAIVGGQVVTTHFFQAPNQSYLLGGVTYTGENYNPLYVGQSVRIANVPMVLNADNTTTFGITNNGWYGQALNDGTAPYTGPGIAYGGNADVYGNAVNSGFVAGGKITETLAAPLQVWNGSAFVASTTNRLQGIRGSLGSPTATTLFSSATGTESASWSTTPTTITPDSHNQVAWRLDTIGTETPDPTPGDGIYLATLVVGTNQLVNGLPVASSLPFYFLFEKNAAGVDVDAANAFVKANLVPEPGLVGVVGALGLLLKRRR